MVIPTLFGILTIYKSLFIWFYMYLWIHDHAHNRCRILLVDLNPNIGSKKCQSQAWTTNTCTHWSNLDTTCSCFEIHDTRLIPYAARLNPFLVVISYLNIRVGILYHIMIGGRQNCLFMFIPWQFLIHGCCLLFAIHRWQLIFVVCDLIISYRLFDLDMCVACCP